MRYYSASVFRSFQLTAAVLLCALLASGCSDPLVTNTKRNAVEQFLLSEAAEQGTDQMKFETFHGRQAFMDYTYLDPQVDKALVKGLVERRLAECGVVIVRDKKAADIVIQIIVPVLATDMSKILVGTPSLPIPVPNTSIQIVIPEIPLFLKLTRFGYGQFSVNILRASDLKPLAIQKGINTRAKFINWALLLVPWTSHNLGMKESAPNADTQYIFFE